MIYIDSSCLVKVIRIEEHSSDVLSAIDAESSVIISELAELEAYIDLKGRHLAGQFSISQWRKHEAALNSLRHKTPFIFKTIPLGLNQTALRQHKNAEKIHCRTLDRLHLAAMEIFKVTRLMTHDKRQAKAALDLGYQVLSPGRSSKSES